MLSLYGDFIINQIQDECVLQFQIEEGLQDFRGIAGRASARVVRMVGQNDRIPAGFFTSLTDAADSDEGTATASLASFQLTALGPGQDVTFRFRFQVNQNLDLIRFRRNRIINKVS